MKLTKFSNLFLLGAALAITASGCKTKQPVVTYLPDPAKPVPTAGGAFHDDVKNTTLPTTTPPIVRNPNGPGTSNPGTGVAFPPLDPGPKITGTDIGTTKPLPETTAIPVPTPPATNAAPIDFSLGTPPNTTNHTGWTEDMTALSPDTVYFDFDKSAIRSSEQAKLAAVADYLRSNPLVAVRVEGNCDERGTEGYNLSLGERRALASREYLIKLGIDAGRVDTITRGEGNPADPGHNEAAWAKNRRDDFILLTAPKP